jgi:hypothetical protein
VGIWRKAFEELVVAPDDQTWLQTFPGWEPAPHSKAEEPLEPPGDKTWGRHFGGGPVCQR